MGSPQPDFPGFNPDMVTLARESRGLTQSEAAARLGISQARLSKIEAGLAEVSADVVNAMSIEFHYPERFFQLSDALLGPGTSEFFHRKRQATPARTLRQVYAQLNIRMMNINRLLRAVEIANDDIPRIDPDEFDGSIEDIARAVRARWHLPPGPVRNLTEAIENAGGIVVLYDFGSPLVDAISRYVPGSPRVFFVDRRLPGDRQRLTLAHELGHAVMHHLPHKDMEDQAFRFAAELLMPEADIRPQFDRVTLPKLAAMKPFWKVSMGALLRRAVDVGRVTPRMERHLWTQMGKAGYRTHEPAELDIPREEPLLLREILELHRKDLGYGLAELGELLVLREDEVQESYGLEPTPTDVRMRLRAVKG